MIGSRPLNHNFLFSNLKYHYVVNTHYIFLQVFQEYMITDEARIVCTIS